MRNPLRYYNSSEFLLNIKTILIPGSFLHIIATIFVYLVGKSAIFPNWIFSQGTMREDASRYLAKCELLSDGLANGNYDFLISSTEQIHLRFYALSHYLLSDILGSNILVFELINLPLFILILLLIYKIGETLFNKKIGFISAYIIIFFPSFILHTTQPLRDTLFIAVFLFLFFQLIKLINNSFDVRKSVILTFVGISTFLLLWFIRDSMILVYLGILLITLVLVLFKNFKSSWAYKNNLIPVFALLIVAFITPSIFTNYLPLKRDQSQEQMPETVKFVEEQRELGRPSHLIKINTIRHRFSLDYIDAGSNIDAGYIFKDNFELIKYIPKATLIGIFSPFPNTWLGVGVEYGKSGRILAGVETALMYIWVFLSLFCLLKQRKIIVLFTALTILIGTTALGLVIPNVGAIYRLRYIFWFLIIILGVNGLFELKAFFSKNKNSHKALE